MLMMVENGGFLVTTMSMVMFRSVIQHSEAFYPKTYKK